MTSRIMRAVPALLAVFALSACAPASLYEPAAVPQAPQPGIDAGPSPSPTPSPSLTPARTPAASLTPEPDPVPDETAAPTPTPDPTAEAPSTPPPPPAVIAVGDEGDRVRELQHRLLQLQWFEGSITPTYGEKTRLAVAGFQTKRGLAELGYVDQQTWDRLAEMTRTPTHDEMHNILTPGPAILADGNTGDDVKELQARLRQVAWYLTDVDGIYGPKTIEAVRGFQGKREIPVTGEVDQRTLDRLHAMTRTPTSDELNNIVPTKAASGMTLDDRCLQGRVICISKAQRQLAWVVDGDIQMVMDVRFGSELTPTRNGVFSVNWKSRDHVSSLYDSPMPYALFFSGGQAIHYSADFAARGYNGASHGCVNVRDKNAVMTLFDTAKNGDKVVVYSG